MFPYYSKMGNSFDYVYVINILLLIFANKYSVTEIISYLWCLFVRLFHQQCFSSSVIECYVLGGWVMNT